MKLVDLSGQNLSTQEESAQTQNENREVPELKLVTEETTAEGTADSVEVATEQPEVEYQAQLQQMLLYVVHKTAQRATLSGVKMNKENMMYLSVETSNVIHNVLLYRVIEVLGVTDLRQLVRQSDLDAIVDGFQFQNPNAIIT